MNAMIRIRGRQLKWTIAVTAMVWAVLAGAGSATQTLETTGCDAGRVECQANELTECVCREGWVETPDGEKFLLVCHWEATGEECGGTDISPCTKAYEGAERLFAGVRKECYCLDDKNCYWRDK